MTEREATNAKKALQDALSEHPALLDAHITTDQWTDGTWWIGIGLTPDEAFTLAETIWQE